MKIGIICGSHRPNSESGRIGRYLSGRIEQQIKNCESYIADLANNPLPLWDESAGSSTGTWAKAWQPMAEQLKSCDGYIVISPEWSGMVPAGLKNLFLLTSADIIGHKPALIVTVSGSRGGAYPVNELRSSSYKNTRICYIPEHIIVRDCEQMLQEESPRSEDDAYLRKRIDYALALLNEYAAALKLVRNSGIIDHKTYPNGM